MFENISDLLNTRGARKYARTEGRKDTRAGSYDRQLQTKAGEVTLTVPKLRTLPFETAINASGCQSRYIVA